MCLVRRNLANVPEGWFWPFYGHEKSECYLWGSDIFPKQQKSPDVSSVMKTSSTVSNLKFSKMTTKILQEFRFDASVAQEPGNRCYRVLEMLKTHMSTGQ